MSFNTEMYVEMNTTQTPHMVPMEIDTSSPILMTPRTPEGSPPHTPDRPYNARLKIPMAPRKRTRDDVAVRRNTPPVLINPDMPNELESVSCELALAFYLQHRNRLLHINDRQAVQVLYMKTHKFWCPVHLRNAPRHVSQVMFAMVNYLRVCRIQGGNISWHNLPVLPPIPTGFDNQMELVRNITVRPHQEDMMIWNR